MARNGAVNVHGKIQKTKLIGNTRVHPINQITNFKFQYFKNYHPGLKLAIRWVFLTWANHSLSMEIRIEED